jgi:hypothetical protein
MKKVKCKHCGRELSDQPNGQPVKVYEHEGEAVCETCLIGTGALPDHKPGDHTRLLPDSYWYWTKNG